MATQDCTNHREAKLFSGARGTAKNVWPSDRCAENMADQQKDGDSPVKMFVPGVLKSAQYFGQVQKDNCSGELCSSEDWDLEKETKPKKVVKNKFTTAFQELLLGKERTSSRCVRMDGGGREEGGGKGGRDFLTKTWVFLKIRKFNSRPERERTKKKT